MLALMKGNHVAEQQWLYLLAVLATAICAQETDDSKFPLPITRGHSDTNVSTCPNEAELNDLQTSLLVLTDRAENISYSVAKLNISIQDSNGTSRNMTDILSDLTLLNLGIKDLSHQVDLLRRSQNDSALTLTPRSQQPLRDKGLLQETVDSLKQDVKDLSETVALLIKNHSHLTTLCEQNDSGADIKKQLFSTNEKLSNLSDQYDAIRAQVNCLKDTLKEKKEKIVPAQPKASSKSTVQSKLYEKTNAIGKQDNSYFFHHMLEIQQVNEARLLNLTSTILKMEKELLALQLNYSTRLRDLEAGQSPTAAHVSQESTSEANQITRSTCKGLRRHLVGNSCYYVPRLRETDLLYTWWDARYLCKQPDILGPKADLVSITSKDEMNAIKHLVTNHFGGMDEFWLGGNDLETEGHWAWSLSGRPLTKDSYTNWGHVPRLTIGQNCMSMLRGFLWAAEPCFYQRYPFCELELA